MMVPPAGGQAAARLPAGRVLRHRRDHRPRPRFHRPGLRRTGAPWLLYVAYQAAALSACSRAPKDMAGLRRSSTRRAGTRSARQRLERQKELGLLPEDTELTPRSRIPNPASRSAIGSLTPDGATRPGTRSPPTAAPTSPSAWRSTPAMVDRHGPQHRPADRRPARSTASSTIRSSSSSATTARAPSGSRSASRCCRRPSRPGHGINQGTQGAAEPAYTGDDLARMGGPGSHAQLRHRAGPTPATRRGGCTSTTATRAASRPRSSSTGRRGIHAERQGAGFVASPSHLIDLMATLRRRRRGDLPDGFERPRRSCRWRASLLPACRRPADGSGRRDAVWEHEGNAAVRVGDWKLVRARPRQAVGTYDLASDRTELHDLAASRPDGVRSLAARWEAWAVRVHVHVGKERKDQPDAAAPKPVD